MKRLLFAFLMVVAFQVQAAPPGHATPVNPTIEAPENNPEMQEFNRASSPEAMPDEEPLQWSEPTESDESLHNDLYDLPPNV